MDSQSCELWKPLAHMCYSESRPRDAGGSISNHTYRLLNTYPKEGAMEEIHKDAPHPHKIFLSLSLVLYVPSDEDTR